MGIKLPELSQEEIEELAKDLMFLLTYHKQIKEYDLNENEKLEYEIWKAKHEREMQDERG